MTLNEIIKYSGGRKGGRLVYAICKRKYVEGEIDRIGLCRLFRIERDVEWPTAIKYANSIAYGNGPYLNSKY